MATKTKTWAQLLSEVEETARKWPNATKVAIENDLDTRGRRRAYHSPEEREVRLRLSWWSPRAERIEIKADVRSAATAPENLRLIAVALETARLAEVRGVEKILALLYRQMFPPPAAPSPPPPLPSEPRQIPPHYALLHLDPSAPLEVAEAAYRALAKRAHPDAGGSTETMRRLNEAIEVIRAEKG